MIKKVYARYVSHTATPIYKLVYKVGCEFDGEERLVMLEPSLYKSYTDVL